MSFAGTIEHCVEAATIPGQPYSVREQIKRAGSGPKAIGLTRMLPGGLLGKIAKNISTHDIYFEGNKIDLGEGIAYGSEAIVYQLGQNVVKKYRSFMSAEQHLASRKNLYEKYCECFGSLVVPTVFVTGPNRIAKGFRPKVFAIQPQVYGKDFFEDPKLAEEEDLELLKTGAETMLVEGICPDIGSGNVLVEDSRIKIVDTGNALDIDEVSNFPEIATNLQTLRNL